MWHLHAILLGFLAFSTACFAGDWLCDTDSSQIVGGRLYACGSGIGSSHGEALQAALQAARNEFNQICDENTSCGTNKYSIEPRRATCEAVDGIWTCYRLIIYTIEPAKRGKLASIHQHNSATFNAHNNLSNQELMDNLVARTYGVWR